MLNVCSIPTKDAHHLRKHKNPYQERHRHPSNNTEGKKNRMECKKFITSTNVDAVKCGYLLWYPREAKEICEKNIHAENVSISPF